MEIISTPYAHLGYRLVDEDDMEDVHDAAGPGGILIAALSSHKTGDASKLLKILVARFPKTRMAVVAYAASGNHERLYRLYARFGFEQAHSSPSIRVRACGV